LGQEDFLMKVILNKVLRDTCKERKGWVGGRGWHGHEIK
jgi:hypothetical protein